MAVSQAGVRPVLLTCALLALALSGALSVALSAPRGTARTRRTSSLGLSSYHSIVSTPEAPGTVLAALKSRGRLRTFFQHARGMLKRALPTYHSASGGQPGTGQAAVKRTSVTLGLLQHAKGILRRALFEDSPLLTSMHGRVQQFQSELRGRAGASLLAAGGAPREPEAPPLQGTSALLKSLHADVAADTTGSDPSAGGSPGEGERKVPGGRVPEEDYFRSDGASREGPREEQGAPGTEGAGEEGNERGGGEGNVREGNKGEEGEGALGGEGGQAAGAGQDVDGAELGDRRSAESGGRKEWQGPESADVEAEASRMGHEASDPAVVAKARELLAAWGSWPWLQLAGPFGSINASVPRPPHIEDCETLTRFRRQLDERSSDGSRPLWSLYGGTSVLALGLNQRPEIEAAKPLVGEGEKEEALLGSQAQPSVVGPLPPWVAGADEDNLILTRRVQRDLWLHQHPRDCGAPGVKFLVANVTHGVDAFLGVGAQLGAMAGLLSEALKLDRVLVLDYYNKADHPGCPGSLRGTFRCYFASETSAACRERALGLVQRGQGVLQGTGTGAQEAEAVAVIKALPYWFKDDAPGLWGAPWEHMHPSVAVGGARVRRTEDDSHRWFRAQALRYLLRFPSSRLCALTNRARHAAFGAAAAVESALALVHRPEGSQGVAARTGQALEPLWQRVRRAVYQGRGELVSMHVRQGDKGREMVIHPFKDYMALAHAIRLRFPNAQSIWLSTEVQGVVDEALTYKGWRFYYTKVARQQKVHGKMAKYEEGLGLEKSMDNAFVNLMIAAGCDYFVGTMGSTWSVVIDDLRRTSGKEPRGMLSVNKDRYWMSSREREENNLIFR